MRTVTAQGARLTVRRALDPVAKRRSALSGNAPCTGKGTTMTSELAKRQCVPCRGGVPALKRDEIESLLDQLGGDWKVAEDHHLEKEYQFRDFATALAFTNAVGAIAEEQGHHPDIYLAWGKVGLRIWTHKIDGLTESDFILAAKADQADRHR